MTEVPACLSLQILHHNVFLTRHWQTACFSFLWLTTAGYPGPLFCPCDYSVSAGVGTIVTVCAWGWGSENFLLPLFVKSISVKTRSFIRKCLGSRNWLCHWINRRMCGWNLTMQTCVGVGVKKSQPLWRVTCNFKEELLTCREYHEALSQSFWLGFNT